MDNQEFIGGERLLQTPNRRCQFCGEGLVCEHGRCDTCQSCFECDGEE